MVVVPPWPGVYTVDSQAMLASARAGRVSDWYSPVLVSLWRVVDAIGVPPSVVFLVSTVVVVVALLAIYRLALPRVWAMVATAGTVLFPPVYGLLGWVGRDVWFLALVLVAAAALGWASLVPERRVALLAVAWIAAWFAADARQNGFPVLAVVGGVTAWLVASAWRHRVLLIGGAAVVAVVLGFGLQRAAHTVTVQRDFAPEQVVYFQDLLAVSLWIDESLVPPELLPSDREDEVRRLWVPAQVGAVLFREDPPVDYRPRRGHERRTRLLRDAWLDMITSHPIAYLAERGDLFRRLLGLGDTPPGAWFRESDQIRGISPGLRQQLPGLNDVRAAYLEAFESGEPGRGGPLHRPWIYVLLGLSGSIALIVTSSRLRVIGWTLLALQASLQSVLAFAAPLLEYRFQLFQIVLGIVAAVLGTHALVTASGVARRRVLPGAPP